MIFLRLIAAIILLVATLTFAQTDAAFAQQVGDRGTVNSSDGELNMRSGPSTGRSILRVLRNGDKVSVLRRSGKWMYVKSAKGPGWVYAPLVAFADKASSVKLRVGSNALVCNDKVSQTNVRYGPSAKDYGVVAKLRNGSQVQIKKVVTNSGGYVYYEIIFQYPGDVKKGAGYIYHQALKRSCNGRTASSKSASSSRSSNPVRRESKDSFPPSALALAGNKCEVIIASRQTAREVLTYFKAMDRQKNHQRDYRKAYMTRTGWYAIGIGIVPKSEFQSKWKPNLTRNNSWMSKDIFCSQRKTFIKSYSQKDLEREASFASKATKFGRTGKAPLLKSEYQFEVREKSEQDLKEEYRKFAALWTQSHTEKAGERVRFERSVKVTTQAKQPKGLEWCQFKIDAVKKTYVDNYLIQTEKAAYYGDAVEIGQQIAGFGEEAKKVRKDLSFSVDGSDLTLSVKSYSAKDVKPGYVQANCSSVLSKGYRSMGHDSCIMPRLEFEKNEDLQVAYRQLQSYYGQCAIPLQVHKAMAMLKKSQAEDVDAFVAKNPQSETAVRAALGDHSGKILKIKDAKLTDISLIGDYPYVANLYLSGNALRDIKPLAKLEKLAFLDLSDNLISDISVLRNLDKLIYLNLKGNNISDISALAGLKNISGLNLKGNPITDLSPIQHLIDDPAVNVITE